MSQHQDTNTRSPKTAIVRAPYVAPRLQFFGAIGALTQAGTVGGVEMGMGMGMGQQMRMA